MQHLAPQSPAMLAAKNPTSEWNTSEEKCDTTGLLAIGKVLSQAVISLDHQPIDHRDVVPKIEPIDDEPSQSYYTLKVDMASENDETASAVDEDDDAIDGEQHTIDLSTKPRERPEAITTGYCNTPVNNNNIINNNNNIHNNSDGDRIVKGSAKRKKPNPMQIVSAKKPKIREENDDFGSETYNGVCSSGTRAVDVAIEDVGSKGQDGGTGAVVVVVDDGRENDEQESTTTTATTSAITTTTINTVSTNTNVSAVTVTTNEDKSVATVKRKNSIKSVDAKSEQEKLDECMTDEILRSVLTDDSDCDDMITEAFVKKKGMPKKTKKGKKDRKNGGNKKEMTGN